MRKIRYNFEIGYAGCDEEGVTVVPDEMTNAEIDEMVYDMAQEYAASWEGDSRLGFEDEMTQEEADEYRDAFYEGVSGSWQWASPDDD